MNTIIKNPRKNVIDSVPQIAMCQKDPLRNKILKPIFEELQNEVFEKHNQKFESLSDTGISFKKFKKINKDKFQADCYNLARDSFLKQYCCISIVQKQYFLKPPTATHRIIKLSSPDKKSNLLFDSIQYSYQLSKIRPQMLNPLRDVKGLAESLSDFSRVVESKNVDIGEESQEVIKELIDTIKDKQFEIGPETRTLLESFRNIFGAKGSKGRNIENLKKHMSFMEDGEAKILIEQLIRDSDFNSHGFYDLIILLSFCTSSLFYALKRSNTSLGIALLTGGMCIKAFSGDAIGIISTIISNMSSSGIQPQMDEDTMETLVHGILALIAAVVCCTTNKKITAATLFAGLGNFDRVKKGSVSLLTFIFELLEKIINFFKTEATPEVRLLHSQIPEIEKFCEESDILLEAENRNEFYRDQEHFNELKAVIISGKKIYSSILRTNKSETSLRLMDRQIRKLEKLKEEFTACMVDSHGMKQEPVGVLLQGPPGVGKSIVMEHLNNAILSSILSDDKFKAFLINPDSFVFNRQSENKYWDGYKNNCEITMFDDFGQALDIAGSPDNEFMNAIRCINGFRTALHTANMAEKGNLTFNSKFVICSTNRKKIECNSLFSTWALNRRFVIRVVVIPHPDYAIDSLCDVYSQRLDDAKLPRVDFNGCNITSMDPRVQMYKHTDINGEPYGDAFDFDHLVKLILQRYEMNGNRHNLTKEQFKDTANAYRGKYRATPQMADIESMHVYTKSVSDYFSESEINVAKACFHLAKEHLHGSNVRSLWRVFPDEADDFAPLDFWIFTMACLVRKYNLSPGELRERTSLVGLYITEFPRVMEPEESLGNKIASCFKDLYKQYRDAAMPTIVKVMKTLSKWKFVIIALLGPFFAHGIYKRMKSPKDDRVVNVQSFGLSDKMRGQPNKGAFHNMARIKPQISSSMDKNGWGIVSKIAKRNTFCIRWQRQSGRVSKLGYLLMIKDRIGLLPFHFIVSLTEHGRNDPSILTDTILFTKPGRHDNFRYKCTVSDLIENRVGDEELFMKDLCLVDLRDFGVQPCADITKYIISDANMSKLDCQFPSALFLPDKDVSSIGSMARPLDHSISIDSKVIGSYEIRDGYSYINSTEEGDCGGFLAYLNPALPHDKIVGIHIAGQTDVGIGFASSFSREFIMKYIDEIGGLIDCEEFIPDSFVENRIISQGQFNYLGESKMSPMRCGSTEISKSLLHNTYTKSDNGWALLRPRHVDGVVIDPFENAFTKYCITNGLVELNKMNSCITSLESFLYSESRVVSTKRVFDLKESLDGLEGDVLFHSIPSKTSAGFPMNINGQPNLKKEYYYSEGEEKEKAFANIEHEVLDTISKAKLGIRKVWIFTDSLKDEKRPIKKVLAGNTRMFSGGPFIYLTVFRMYFGAFSLWILKNKNVNSIVSGVNPYSTEWDLIARELKNCAGGLVGAGDYKGFDGSLNSTILYGILKIINNWYDDGNQLIREVLWMEVINSRHIKDGSVYEWCGSLPSGHFFTLIINCLYNNIAFRYCWLLRDLPIDEFNSSVVLKVCGDDNLFAVVPKYQSRFNELTLAKDMAVIGLTYTTEFKDTAILPFRDLTQVEFLKRGFRYENLLGRYVAPLRLEVVLDIPMWTKKGADRDKITIGNTIEALRELSLHPEDVYYQWENKIIQAFIKHYPGSPTPHPLKQSRCERLVSITNDQRFII